MNDGFLQPGQLGVPHFDAEIAARDHHNVRRLDNAGEIGYRFVPLDLGDDVSFTARLTHQRARLFYITRIAREGDGDVVDVLLGAKADVLAIFVGERRRRNSAALPVQALAVR